MYLILAEYRWSRPLQVFLMCNSFKMLGVNTATYLTCMVYLISTWYGTVEHFIEVPMAVRPSNNTITVGL